MVDKLSYFVYNRSSPGSLTFFISKIYVYENVNVFSIETLKLRICGAKRRDENILQEHLESYRKQP